MKKKQIFGSFILVFIAIIWGGSFVAQSSGGNIIGPFSFSCLRYLVATLATLPVVKLLDVTGQSTVIPKTKEQKVTLIKGGIICGIFLAGTTIFQQLGMFMGTSPGKAGFLTSCYIFFVPVIGLIFKKKNDWNVWLAVFISLIGLYMLCVKEDFSLAVSDIMLIICSIACASRILAVSSYMNNTDVARLACLQFFTASMIAGVLMVFVEMKSGIAAWWKVVNCWDVWSSLLYAGVLAGAVAFTLQIVAQKHVNTTVASLLMSLESVFSVLAGWLILKNKLSVKELMGCFVIFIAIVIAQIPFRELISKRKNIQNLQSSDVNLT